MIKLWALTGAHLVGVLTAVPACMIAAGYTVVSSLAAPASPAVPTITGEPPSVMVSTATATFTFTSSPSPSAFECSLDAKAYATLPVGTNTLSATFDETNNS
jgi:hypothetical protein